MPTASPGGLTSAEAAARLVADGPNQLPPPRRPSALRRLVHQLVHFFALMLWGAGSLAFFAGLPQLAVAVFAVIVVNAVFAFVQEQRADRAAERLQGLLPRQVTVRRDGARLLVDAADVVRGDIVVQEAGDRVPADANVVAASGLRLDTSLLSGESLPAEVHEGDALFAGTFVVEGQCDAVVTATGGGTRLAEISRLTTSTSAPETPLTRELKQVVRVVAAIAVGVGSAFFLIALLLGDPVSDGFVFAIGVTVALVPEALLPTVTLSLAWGAEQMAKRNVLVRNLEAVETLGSTTFICTDKTGTLTENQMTVVEAWTPTATGSALGGGYDPTVPVTISPADDVAPIRALALAGVRASNGYAVQDDDGSWRAHGDPMEAALDVFARRLGVDTGADHREHPPSAQFPFDPHRRRMSLVVDGMIVVKGAPDALLPYCTEEPGVAAALARFTERGLRVLAVARRPVQTDPATAEEAERGLRLLGLVAMEDPPRHDVRSSIDACRRAGVKVAMITGDHPATAAAIATEVGLRAPDGLVLVGDELPDDSDQLGALIDRDGVVMARVDPETKLRIARALRARGNVVAMTGDGVNDGPALHEADIGVAMGRSGTDVAREASDMVLLDDHFASIVAGIEQGRATFLNIRRFLTYHLTDNVAEVTPFLVWALSGGRFPLALGVLQILALDLGTDTLSAVALGAEPPAPDTLSRPPITGRLLNRTVARRAFGVLGPTEAAMSMVAFLATFVLAGWRPGDSFPGGTIAAAASGAAFLAVVAGQAANAFACRSSSAPASALGWTTNRLMIPAISIGVAVSLAAVFVGPVARELDHGPPTIGGWLVVFAAPVVLLGVDTLVKVRARGRRAAVDRSR